MAGQGLGGCLNKPYSTTQQIERLRCAIQAQIFCSVLWTAEFPNSRAHISTFRGYKARSARLYITIVIWCRIPC